MPHARLRPQARRRAGFTLIELLVTMGIIALLVAISIPAVMKAREAANRTTCINNLSQIGIAVQSYHDTFSYYPPAGLSDLSAPSFPVAGSVTTGGTTTTGVASSAPTAGWQQEAGWAFQILPYLGENLVWSTSALNGTTKGYTSTAYTQPIKYYFCPSRRRPTTLAFSPAGTGAWPGGPAASYSATYYTAITSTGSVNMAPIDYAACNGSNLGLGCVRSQLKGGAQTRDTVRNADVTDGLSYQLLVGEKAATTDSRYHSLLVNEDDQSFAAGYSAANFNTVRFATPALMPLRDTDVKGPTNGAFGAAHHNTWSAVMCDGSVQSISYSIDPNVFSYLGCINDGNIVNTTQLDP